MTFDLDGDGSVAVYTGDTGAAPARTGALGSSRQASTAGAPGGGSIVNGSDAGAGGRCGGATATGGSGFGAGAGATGAGVTGPAAPPGRGVTGNPMAGGGDGAPGMMPRAPGVGDGGASGSGSGAASGKRRSSTLWNASSAATAVTCSGRTEEESLT